MTSRIPTIRRFSITTRTCVFDEACTYAFLLIVLVLPTCLFLRPALNPICSIWFLVCPSPKKNYTSLSQRGSQLRIWVPWRRCCQSYNAVLVPVTVSVPATISRVGFRRICLSRYNCNIHSFIQPALPGNIWTSAWMEYVHLVPKVLLTLYYITYWYLADQIWTDL